MSADCASDVLESYRQIDDLIDQFQASTGLTCPPGCGQCCENPNVYTTPLEMIPLVLELYRRGDADDWLQHATSKKYQGSCVFYQPDPLIQGNGRCQVYPWRPSICRLFGFSTRPDKAGLPELAVCKRHKQTMPDVVAQAQGAIAQGTVEAPSIVEWPQCITSLDPNLGSQRMPINEALAVAIERIGLWMQMTSSEEPREDGVMA